jgi:hypothetical protein
MQVQKGMGMGQRNPVLAKQVLQVPQVQLLATLLVFLVCSQVPLYSIMSPDQI